MLIGYVFLIIVVMACSAISNIVKSSLGPVGLDKMMVDDIGVSKLKLFLFKNFVRKILKVLFYCSFFHGELRLLINFNKWVNTFFFGVGEEGEFSQWKENFVWQNLFYLIKKWKMN